MSYSQSTVILSGAKLQRSGRSPRGQAFNLRSSLGLADSEMFESLASCFAFRCNASLNMTMTTGYLVRLNLPVKR
jgi:hypothetical protein